MRERRGPGVAERKMAVPAGPRLVGGARLDGRVGTNALTPFWRCRGPPPRPRAPAARPAPPLRSGSFHSRRRVGGRRAAPAKSGSSRGEGTQARHYHFDCFDAIFGGGGVGRPFSAEHKDV